MPANLPPQYYEVEKTFRAAKSPEEKIAILEEMLAIMPKHKGTDHLRAELRGRIAKLTQLAGKKTSARRASMSIEKEGAAQIVLVGPPNVGKSKLVASITNASPTVAEYPFTTQTALPGMMPFENIHIQLIDTPPLTQQPVEWWYRHLLVRGDALLVVVDLSDAPLNQMEEVINCLAATRIAIGEMKEGESNTILYHKKALIIGNKLDKDNASANYSALQDKYQGKLPLIAVSAREGKGLEGLKHAIYQMLNIIRIYTKTPGHKPDFNDPIILEQGSTLEAAAAEVHKDFVQKMKFARIWGSGKHDGVMAKRDHTLEDGDIIELHL